uniref:Uncharacterized protein n=1 Tax=Anguilla anguilla TaxID=7936 RepID=A0A0E9PM38_ANGAN
MFILFIQVSGYNVSYFRVSSNWLQGRIQRVPVGRIISEKGKH